MLANASSLAVGQLITWTATLVWTIVVPRYVGPTDMGVLTIAVSVASFAAMVLAVPHRNYLVRTIVSDPSRADQLVSTAFLVRLLLSPLIVLSAHLYGVWVGFDDRAMVVMYLIAIGAALTLLQEPAIAAFQASERMHLITIGDITSKVTSGLGGVGAVLLGLGVVAVAGLQAIGPAVALVVLLIVLSGRATIKRRPADVVRTIRASTPYWLVSLGFVGYLWADGLMLGFLVPTEVAGWYGVATRLFTTLMFVAVIAQTTSMPRTVAAFNSGGADAMATAARQPFEWVVILGLAMGVGTAMVSDEAIRLLYGPEFAGAAPILAVLAATLPLMYANIMINQQLIAAGRPGRLGVVLGMTALANVGFNAVLIPLTQEQWGNGGIGAAVAMLLAETIQLSVTTVMIGRRLMTASVVSRVARAAVSAAAMAGVLNVLDGRPLVVQVVAGTAVFAAALMLLRVPATEERAAVRSASRRLVGRGTARMRAR
jgi:O-antigen/teichoic acid export membrane protein